MLILFRVNGHICVWTLYYCPIARDLLESSVLGHVFMVLKAMVD